MSILKKIPKEELKAILLREYKRRFRLYKIVDEKMKKKYNMSFEEFERMGIVKEKGYSWDVENDAMEWEHAIEGIRYIQEKIKELTSE
uniref:Uncharacterized protein n=1 Tax=Dictyoglomus thermophilum TaxID=14 RepID=A0A7C3RW53_DICTH